MQGSVGSPEPEALSRLEGSGRSTAEHRSDSRTNANLVPKYPESSKSHTPCLVRALLSVRG